MRAVLTSIAFLLLALRASAGPTGAVDSHAARATGFPGAYLGTVSLSLDDDPLYDTRLLDAMEMHLRSVGAMTAAPAVSDYLENAVMSAQHLAGTLGSRPLDPPKAAALLIANALARPRQLREVLDGLETIKPGLGKQAALVLRQAKGSGDKQLIAALRAAGGNSSRGRLPPYGLGRRLERVFDASPEEDPAPAAGAAEVPSAQSMRLD